MYVTVGDREATGDRDMVQDLRSFTEQINRRSYQGLSLQIQVLADETHNTIFPAGLTRGLRFLYPPKP